MQTVSCPTCGDPLADAGGYCARCGQAALTADVTRSLKHAQEGQSSSSERNARGEALPGGDEALLEWINAGPTAKLSPRGVHTQGETPPQGLEAYQTLELTRKTANAYQETPPNGLEAYQTLKLTRKTANAYQEAPPDLTESTLNLKRMRRGARARLEADMLASSEQALEEDPDDEVIEQRATWQKVVEHRTGPTLPIVAAVSPGLFQHLRASLQANGRSPRMYFWLSVAVLCCLLLAGGFGIASSFGHSAPPPPPSPLLQASPTTIALGGIITLRGLHFSPHGTVALSRDGSIALEDTGGASSVQADARGLFSDTVIVDPAWLAGPHTFYALDMHTHRQALAKIMVTGQNALQGPPRLLLSSSSLDLGSGDEATNTSKLLALSNAGGGEVTWQATTSQPWLGISPMSGSISSGSHLSAMVAVDRARLAPGVYHASILFLSSTERITLAVTMTVIPLQPEHEAVLQTLPATLSFSGSARGPAPQVQTVLVSNPGVQQLSWGASISLQNGSGWLWMTQQAGNIAPGGQQQILVGVSTQNLAPGLYKGEISFFNQGTQPIQGSPQVIYVSLTVTPPCVLAFAPGNLSFTGVHRGAAPVAQTLRINVAQGCTTSQNWSASVRTTSGGGWLHLSQTSASTPASPSVSVNTTGLAPGTYNGTLTFTVNTGPQIVPVTLTVSPIPCTISAPSSLTLQGTAGQAGMVSQAIALATAGDCPHALNWTSTVSSASWLSATSAGTLTQPGTASVNMQASLAGLSAGSYTGQVTITAVDSVTGQTVGSVQTSVTLNVQPPCTLQTPAPTSLTFTANAGSTTTQSASVTIGVTGNCAGNVTITPSSNSSWLSAGSAASIASGGTATFTITVDPTGLAANTYTGTITLTAADGNGTITGSPQTVSVTLTIQ
jgi:hypothetical protein